MIKRILGERNLDEFLRVREEKRFVRTEHSSSFALVLVSRTHRSFLPLLLSGQVERWEKREEDGKRESSRSCCCCRCGARYRSRVHASGQLRPAYAGILDAINSYEIKTKIENEEEREWERRECEMIRRWLNEEVCRNQPTF